MLPTLFCPECQAYLGAHAATCPACGRARRADETLPESGQPLWQAKVGGAVHGASIAGELVVFYYGERNGKGGVCALRRTDGDLAWSFETPHAVEAGLAQLGKWLYFATCGFLGAGAELYCLRREDGALLWKQPLSGGVWSRPLVDEARVYVGQDDGAVHCFDSRDGTPLCTETVALPRGRLWLARLGEQLIALAQRGQIIALNPLGLGRAWPGPLEVGWEISSAPCQAEGKLYFGGKGGQVLALEVRARKVNVLARDLGGVVAAPACAGDLLLVPAQDHHLHAYDLRRGAEAWKSDKFEHGLSSAPDAAEGLVAAGVNQVGAALLEAQTGCLAWLFRVGEGVRLLSDPILSDGVVYVGADNGQVFALPWHLGRYEWAAGHCQAKGDWLAAGAFYALAAQNTLDPAEQERCYQAAEACWQRAGRMELAARLWEHLIEEQRAAAAYCQAGQQWIGRDNRQAAEYYSLAAQLYWRLGEEQAVDDCNRKVQKLICGPLLRITQRTDPRLTQYEKGPVTFRLENVGKERAEGLYLNLGGSLLDMVTCQVQDPLLAGGYFDVTVTITPTKLENDLLMQVEYLSTSAQEKPYRATYCAVIEAETSPIEVEFKDTVALRGIELKITDQQNRRIRYKLDTVVASSIRIGE